MSRRWEGAWWLGTWTALVGLVLLATTGCGRSFYRCQADREVHGLVGCVSDDPRWPLDGFTIEPDPRSRMFDPFCPDYPPMPPDDPTSHRLMHCVDCKRGRPCWHCDGDTPDVENPSWRAYLQPDEPGEVVLDREGAVEMALLHSREYQLRLEDVYLSALDVTLERFQFDVQFFGGNNTFFTADGPLSGRATESSTLSTGTTAGAQRLFATGGQLAVDVANSVVWEFAGAGSHNARVPLTFELTQPLLRAAGRAVVLESLTDSERELLAVIRDMERFRHSFYVDTATDYIDLLEEQVRIRNQEINLVQLRQSLERLVAAYQGGGTTSGNVDRTRQSLYNSQSGLLLLNASHETRLDAYKLTLGLPPQLDVCVEDPLLARFDLISPKLTAIREAVDKILQELRKLQDEGQFVPEDHRGVLAAIQADSAAEMDLVEKDMQALDRALPERRRSLQLLAGRDEIRRGEIDESICDSAELDSRVAALNTDYAAVTEALGAIFQELESFDADSFPAATEPGAEDPAGGRFIYLVDEMSKGLLDLSLIQAQARLDAVTMVPIDLTPEEAVQTARENRRDWMNERAILVDSWRQIEVVANRLESDLNLTFSGGLTPTSNTLSSIHNTTGQIQVGLEFDAPLTRLAERNAYRMALINYQRARRDYYAFEDAVAQDLRRRLRNMRLNQLNFEVQRAAVHVAIARVDESGLNLRKPPKDLGGRSQLGESFVETLLDAFRSLLEAQNRFLNVWVDQEVERMNLDLDLGTMQLDDRGLWIDPGPIEGGGGDGRSGADDPPLPPADPEPIPAPAGEPVGPDGMKSPPMVFPEP